MASTETFSSHLLKGEVDKIKKLLMTGNSA